MKRGLIAFIHFLFRKKRSANSIRPQIIVWIPDETVDIGKIVEEITLSINVFKPVANPLNEAVH